ncbi:MAG: PKD domain-containing protein, partial [Gammaproteobacteria bacterium]|nr:PKD domain-containing protein [Gammaproteobacteria bacterium]
MSYVIEKGVSCFTACIIMVCLVFNPAIADDDDDDHDEYKKFKIKETKWNYEKKRLQIKGVGAKGRKVVVTASGSTLPLGTATVRDEEWKVRVYNLTSVPCKVKATQSDGRTHEKRVKKAPRNCTTGDDTNSPPTAYANGSYSGITGNTVNFRSAGSADSDGSIASYAWSFGDGGSSNQANPKHTYTKAATYKVTLTVRDNKGASVSDSTTAAISNPVVNSPPTANANGPYAVTTNVSVNFSSAGSEDSDGSIASYA